MKRNFLTPLSLMVMFALGMGACSSEETLPAQDSTNDKAPHTCNLVFEGEIERFEAETRAAGWENDDTIFLAFAAGEKTIQGTAVFNATSGIWNLSYQGDMPDASSTCKAYHFKEGLSKDLYETTITFSGASAVYGDTLATYSKSGNEVKVKAHLKPFTGRIRFSGEPGTKFTLQGVKRYMTYDVVNGGLESGHTAEVLLVGSDGYTPYVYGSLPKERPHLWAVYDEVSFMMVCPNNVLVDGKSGFMAVPTEQGYRGWKRNFDKPFSVNGAFFVMKYVQGGTFTMGATAEQLFDANENEKPAHEVTLSDYYIGETEVTNELWYALLKTDPYTPDGRNLPRSVGTWTEWKDLFCPTLSLLTGENFTMPTEAQWEYAARGGSVSKGYRYSGSNDLDEVAWYCDNSDYQLHLVATKKPNELGIYDMSGNVGELCLDAWNAYSSEAQTDPVYYDYEDPYKVLRGGKVDNLDYDCRVTTRSVANYDSSFGFRLALTLK